MLGGCTFNTNGTSAAAPIWAALLARIYSSLDKSFGWITPLMYHPYVSSTFNDISTTNNIWPSGNSVDEYDAESGWDPCCGWGSPNGAALRDALAVLSGSLQVTPQPPTRSNQMIVVDFGRTSEEKLAQLRDGRGTLAREIGDLSEQLLGFDGAFVAVVETQSSSDGYEPWSFLVNLLR